MRKYWLNTLPSGQLAGLVTSMLGDTEQNKVLKTLTGIKTYDADKQNYKEKSEKAYEKELMNIMQDAGLMGNINYMFKDVKEKIK